jgi:low affinity Fe/Cu permease
LVYALYIPYFVLLLLTIALWISPPAPLPRLAFTLVFLLTLSIAIVSFALAVPLHQQHTAQLYITPEQLDELLRVNLVRLAAATTSSSIVLWMLNRLLSPFRASHATPA